MLVMQYHSFVFMIHLMQFKSIVWSVNREENYAASISWCQLGYEHFPCQGWCDLKSERRLFSLTIIYAIFLHDTMHSERISHFDQQFFFKTNIHFLKYIFVQTFYNIFAMCKLANFAVYRVTIFFSPLSTKKQICKWYKWWRVSWRRYREELWITV